MVEEESKYKLQKQKLWEAKIEAEVAYLRFVQEEAVSQCCNALNGRVYKYSHLIHSKTSAKTDKTFMPEGFKSKLATIYVTFHPDRNSDRKYAHQCMALINQWVQQGQWLALAELHSKMTNDSVQDAWQFLKLQCETPEPPETKSSAAISQKADTLADKMAWLKSIKQQNWIAWALDDLVLQQAISSVYLEPEEYAKYMEQFQFHH